jgi:hypothetical protein
MTGLVSLLLLLLVFAIPAMLIAWLVVSIVFFAKTPKGMPKKSFWRGMLIASSICTGLYFLIAVAILAVTTMSVSLM